MAAIAARAQAFRGPEAQHTAEALAAGERKPEASVLYSAALARHASVSADSDRGALAADIEHMHVNIRILDLSACCHYLDLLYKATSTLQTCGRCLQLIIQPL